MAMFEVLSVGEIRLTTDHKTKMMFSAGATTTRAVIRSTYNGDARPVGSIAICNDRIYLKIAAADADADWYKVTTSNAD